MAALSRIAVLGAGGQVGRALLECLGTRGVALTRAEADLLEPERALHALERIAPDAVINAAAYTQVDQAESEEEIAQAANAVAPAAIAAWCAGREIPFIHYSTDYVFNGSGELPWREDDAPAPLNAYGRTKLAGERGVGKAGGKHLIFRTSWVYDAEGRNFLNTMLRLGNERDELKVVADQTGAPGYAPHLAAATLHVLEKAILMETFPSGIYHMANGGETTWYGFAEAIFAAAREAGIPLRIKNVEPIPSVAYPTPAERPRNSRLDCRKLQHLFSESLPHWRAGLAEAMEARRASHQLSD